MLTVGSLFAGIGGFDLGLERTGGFQIKWQVEIDEYCQRVLAKHWPNVKRYGDIRTVTNVERVDVLCGGFPCQDISWAGFGGGLEGERSGLFYELARLVPISGARILILENVPALLHRGMGEVLATLAELRFDAEWSCVSACSMGATHMRDRVFIVAHSNSLKWWPRVRDSFAYSFRALQEVDSFESARTDALTRLANPSALYGDPDGVPFGHDRDRALGNSVYPAVVEWIGNQILAYERSLTGVSS